MKSNSLPLTRHSARAIIEQHIRDHQRIVGMLAGMASDIAAVADMVVDCLQNQGRVFWCGNGGSAADCQHLAAELVGRFERERPGFASIALTTDSSVLTAVANDYGFERVFARQIEALARSGDLLIGISTSGNSSNVLAAFDAATDRGIRTIALSGRDGGALASAATLSIVVPDGNTARIQEAHILVGHIVCDLVETRLSQAH